MIHAKLFQVVFARFSNGVSKSVIGIFVSQIIGGFGWSGSVESIQFGSFDGYV